MTLTQTLITIRTLKLALRVGGQKNITGIWKWKHTMSSLDETQLQNQEGGQRDKCVFCKIADGKEKNTIHYQDDEFVVFDDIKPATQHHYLIIPRHHYVNAKSITSEQIPLVERMVSIGKQCLQQRGGDADTARLGFHWPPFNSINHLHLHVIAPQKEMGFIARGIFKENSFWFVSPETVIDGLRSKD